jgi:hypothetical protein
MTYLGRKPKFTLPRPIHQQYQVGITRRLAACGDHGMRLAAMVGLVIEQMRHQKPALRSHLATGGATEPDQVIGKPRSVTRAAHSSMPASAFTRSAASASKSSIIVALSLIRTGGRGHPSKRAIHT